MDIEYEATFPDIIKNEIRSKLKKAGAKLIRPEFLQKRITFCLPGKRKYAWLRVRDDNGKVSMSYKIVDGDRIEDQKEICLKINNFERGVEFLTTIGCKKKAYQETKRELWLLDGVEITIDEWPFLEPFVEVEGGSEEDVKKVCKKISLDYSQALFCAVGELYKRKYGVSLDYINNRTPRIMFNSKNPFIKTYNS